MDKDTGKASAELNRFFLATDLTEKDEILYFYKEVIMEEKTVEIEYGKCKTPFVTRCKDASRVYSKKYNKTRLRLAQLVIPPLRYK